MSKESDVDKAARNTAKNIFRPGITPEEVKAGYDDWSKNYDEMLGNSQYRAPAIALEEVLLQVPPEKRAQTKVLDVAAGTGWVGRDLHREGFRHIDAVEPSEGMIKKLRECGVYTNDFMEFIGTGHSTVPKDTYDLVIISGGMGEGHIPVSGLDDLVRVAKNGGLVIISMRLEFLEIVSAYKDKLEPYMDELEEDGKWRKVERRVVPNYFFDKEGVVYVYCVTKN
ncbi:methyltransferase-like protein 27 [Eriocheir sinensis]|uniref:methyltransferase-like protein 27 n=1 Tax=Eriocheir sinensis TaxID=95602 RepID=UPI0021C721E3|nr:methyltransferase-like protein 27 [Eriocheir sinensis]XP_050704257.1 methyltransferase-like protein 27 [Eriocheir sinensis]XP_050704258.1 methyltransferase-like protein 27 [Eriocheir sinensis]XP_050704259.1 methyltransferase-like protein 27 [Eriocheir sinensis]XP_050704260.1 methyltransferase-like protein 27 [Eriocheir sinensis]XP_050704261.1 methyltransferase-like protein 27 [Eriocheir sinensis]XP_050704262.1 methyltransferase-like protein 27 [Eriocheir sinensis]XP_050704263.1 methyltran